MNGKNRLNYIILLLLIMGCFFLIGCGSGEDTNEGKNSSKIVLSAEEYYLPPKDAGSNDWLRRTEYTYNENGDYLEKKTSDIINDEATGYYITESYTYGEDGDLQSSVEVDVNGKTHNTHKYETDENGNIAEERIYNKYGKLSDTKLYSYDSENRIVEEQRFEELYEESKLENWTLHEYNEQGNEVKTIDRILHSGSDIVIVQHMYYDEQGRVERAFCTSQGGVLEGRRSTKMEFEYDEQGNVKKVTNYNEEGDVSDWTTYEYTMLDKPKEKNTKASHSNVTYEDAYQNVLKGIKWEYPEAEDYREYNYCDMDGDNTPELIVKTGTCEADTEYQIYRFQNGCAVSMGSLSGGSTSAYRLKNQQGMVLHSASMGYETVTLIKIDDGKLSKEVVLDREIKDTEEYLNMKALKKYTGDDVAEFDWKHIIAEIDILQECAKYNGITSINVANEGSIDMMDGTYTKFRWKEFDDCYWFVKQYEPYTIYQGWLNSSAEKIWEDGQAVEDENFVD